MNPILAVEEDSMKTGYILAAGALIPTYILNEKEVVFIDSGVHYDPGLMKRREPYDRMVAIVERLIILLTTPEKH